MERSVNMNCEFIKLYVVSSTDGYTERPEAYFSNILKAKDYLKSKGDVYYSLNKDPISGVQIEDKFYILGEEIDLDGCQETKHKALIASAKQKLTLEELNALINKG